MAFEEILNGFHIVIGSSLDLFNLKSILVGKVFVDGTQFGSKSIKLLVEICQLGKRQFAEGDEIFNFYADTVTDECTLGEILG